jgi:hypothetical protein
MAAAGGNLGVVVALVVVPLSPGIGIGSGPIDLMIPSIFATLGDREAAARGARSAGS